MRKKASLISKRGLNLSERLIDHLAQVSFNPVILLNTNLPSE
jgi:hypothetical protein